MDECELTFRIVRFLSFAGVPVADSRAQLRLGDSIVPEAALQGDLPGAIHALKPSAISSQRNHLHFDECSVMELWRDCDGSGWTMRAEHFGVNTVDVGPQVNVADVDCCTHDPAQIGARGPEDRFDIGNGLGFTPSPRSPA